jgi:hypothetical protein
VITFLFLFLFWRSIGERLDRSLAQSLTLNACAHTLQLVLLSTKSLEHVGGIAFNTLGDFRDLLFIA